jgi:4-hydroxybenzoate polyprenyltransferase
MNTGVVNYFKLIKFSHTVFAMPFALIGFFLGIQSLAPGASVEEIRLFVLVIACMVFARSAAMAFNRYLDRYFDALNPRTAQREIPVGVIKPRQALAFTVGMSVLFVSCAWLINTLCFFLSPLALLIILGYSYTKRFTPLCHMVLGAGLSLAPIGAYLAVTGQFAMVPLFFSFAVLTWVSGFDIIYSLQDETFDRSQDLYSIPVWLGTKKALGVSRVLHSASFILIGLAGWYGPFGWIYWGGALLYGGLLIYQQWLVSPVDLSRVNLAFMTVNGIASILFSVFVIADLYIQ